MSNLARILEEELQEAFEVKNKKALSRYVTILTDNVVEKGNVEMGFMQVKDDIKTLAEVMREGFRQVDKRLEEVDKRFEQVDKRFEQMMHYMDKRFEQVDKRFSMLMWFIGIIMALSIAVIKFI